MSFDDYKAEDFLQDQSFLNYCIGRNGEDCTFWEGWIRDNPQKENEIKQAIRLYAVLNGNITADTFRKDEAYFLEQLDQYKSETALSGGRPRSAGSLKWLYGAAAAAAIIGLLFFSGWLETGFSKRGSGFKEISRAGERRAFQLPDGSHVLLNSASTITVPEGFKDHLREITLEGEAFFEVSHLDGKPFVIHTKKMDIRVLGTVFNVRAYPNEDFAETALVEGSVEVSVDGEREKKVLLKPSEKLVVSTGTKRKSPDAAYKIDSMSSSGNDASISWTKNRLVFKDETFETIASHLERWFGVTISFESEEVRNYRFTATFEKKTINQVLDALKLSRTFNYRLEDRNTYVITK